MSNDISSFQSSRLELPVTQPTMALEKARSQTTAAAPNEVKADPAPDPAKLRAQLQEATEQLNRQMQRDQRDLSFSVDGSANKIVVTVKNTESGEVIRQIPSEAALRVAHNLDEIKGLLEDKKI